MADEASTTGATLKAPLRVRPKRAGSSLGGHPRGDTGVGSLTTIESLQKVCSHVRMYEAVLQRGYAVIYQHELGQQTGNSGDLYNQAAKKQPTIAQWLSKNTWFPPLAILLSVLAFYYANPGEHNPVRPAIFLSYANPPLIERTTTLPARLGNPTQYGKGKKDFIFVAFYTVFFTFTREFLMQRVIRPIAIWFGIRSAAKQARFLEQFYTAIYFGVFGPFGLWVMSRTPVWYFRTAGMYESFPHRAHESYFKAYYLLQAAYWSQQAIVLILMLEKPRKDFKELVLHHIVTLSLIFLSYRFHFTYMGIAVYITHDVSDFFLASVKVLNYIQSPLAQPYYVFFIGVWAYLRHFINLTILYSMLPGGEFETVGRYDLSWPEQQYKCWLSQSITFSLLAILQAVNLFWFFLILRILFKFVLKGVIRDSRSDNEEEEEEEEEVEEIEPAPLVLGEAASSGKSTATEAPPARTRRKA